jgi:hypothetical protein
MPNFQVTYNQDLMGKEVLNVCNWQLADNTDTYIAAFVESLRASYATHVQAYLSDDWSLESFTLRQMDGGLPFTTEVVPASGAIAGSATAGFLPSTVAMLVSTVYVGGRPNRGRVYFAGLTEQHQDNSAWSVATTNAFRDLVQAWADGLVVAGGNAFLRIARMDYPANNWALNNPVNNVIARTNPASQRKRRLGSS